MPKGVRLPPEPLTRDEVLALIAACGSGICGLRDRAMIVMFWRGGLRCSEVLALRPRDIDRGPDGLTIRIANGKGNKSRTVAIGVDASAHIERWLDVRLEKCPGKWVFGAIKHRVGRNDMRMSGSNVRKLMTRLGEKAGIAKRVHAHGLRHTFSLELDAEGFPLGVIQRGLGHSNAATTSVYLSALGSREVVGALRARRIDQ
jgi:integrase